GHLGRDLLDQETRIVLHDHEALYLVRGLLARPDHIDVGERRVTYPLLLAVEDPMVALPSTGRQHAAGRPRTDQRLGQSETTDLLPAHHPREPALLLAFR